MRYDDMVRASNPPEPRPKRKPLVIPTCYHNGCETRAVTLLNNPYQGYRFLVPRDLPTDTDMLWLCSKHYAIVNRREGIIWGYKTTQGHTRRYVKEETRFK